MVTQKSSLFCLATVLIFLPIVGHDDTNPRKGVALAYGWVANPDGADVLNVGTVTCWGLSPCTGSGTTLAQFWSECWPSPHDCRGNYLNELVMFAELDNYSRFLTVNGRPVVKFLNEPDNRSQANDSPAAAVSLYKQAREICPHCIFTFPGVGAWDYFCDWPDHERTTWHAEIDDGGQWCWSRAFLRELDKAGVVADFEICSFHHYYSIGWHEPKRNIAPMEPGNALAALVGCDKFVIPEYGTCDPDFMEAMTNAYDNDSRVLAYYVWTPNLPPAGNGFSQCEVLFDWQTGALTAVGAAFAEAGK